MSDLSAMSSTVLDTGRSVLTLRWLAAAFVIGFVGYGVTRRRSQDARRRYWPSVRGRVVSERDTGDSTAYESIVLFRTLDGTEIQGVPRGGVYLGMPVAGREVPVWYDPRDPNLFEARIYPLDRSGSLLFLAAVVPAALFLLTLFP